MIWQICLFLYAAIAGFGVLLTYLRRCQIEDFGEIPDPKWFHKNIVMFVLWPVFLTMFVLKHLIEFPKVFVIGVKYWIKDFKKKEGQ